MTNIILFSGKAEAGKTTAARYLKENLIHEGYSAKIISYSDYVKHTAMLLMGWNGIKDEFGRGVLQRWGTDIVRKRDPMFWVNTVKRLVDVSDDIFDYILIDDCRFPNEIEVWKDYQHITVRVENPNHLNALSEEQRKHPSETALDDYEMDVTLSATNAFELNNAVLLELLDKAVAMKINGKIYAVDFDGTLCSNNWPHVGEPNTDLIEHLIHLRGLGARLILWTCRSGNMLNEATAWCKEHGLEFEAVNENLPDLISLYGNDSRKVCADEYIDDKMSTNDKYQIPFVKEGLTSCHTCPNLSH